MSDMQANEGADRRPNMKRCRSCNRLKPVTDFSKRANSKDGLQYECKPCYNRRQHANYALRKKKDEEFAVPEGILIRQGSKCHTCGSGRELLTLEINNNPMFAVCKRCYLWVMEIQRVGELGFDKYVHIGNLIFDKVPTTSVAEADALLDSLMTDGDPYK